MPITSSLQVSYRTLDAFAPYPKNARTHSPEQIAQIAASIREFGFVSPVLVDEHNTLIAGHGRLDAARRLGLEQIPAIELTGLTAAQKRALRLADNRIALSGGWSDELLRFELGELKFDGFNLALTGFSDLELTALLTPRTQGLTDPDDVPEPPPIPVTRPGDVWLMGGHRLLCGDATSATDVAKALDGVRPHLMVTDPPYGVGYEPAWRDAAFGEANRAIGVVQNDNRADWSYAWLLFPGDVVYAWHPPGAMQVDHFNALVAAGFEIRMQIIWAKQHFPIGRGNYHVQHEPCWYAVRKGAVAHWSGDRTQSTLWQINNGLQGGNLGKPENGITGHSTQKPVECMRRPIENNSSPGQAVYDPFVGSGTTIIAAEMTGRSCHAIEISPAYVDCGIIRWQNFTGAEATLERTGQTYSEVVAACRSNADTAELQSHSASSGSTSEASTLPGASHATA